MNRKLHQCPACREYFNTTPAVMVDHYRVKHQRAFDKAMAIGELVVKRAMFTMQARNAPWPLSMQYAVSAIMTGHQIDRIAAEAV